jgi:hypothetical protein
LIDHRDTPSGCVSFAFGLDHILVGTGLRVEEGALKIALGSDGKTLEASPPSLLVRRREPGAINFVGAPRLAGLPAVSSSIPYMIVIEPCIPAPGAP